VSQQDLRAKAENPNEKTCMRAPSQAKGNDEAQTIITKEPAEKAEKVTKAPLDRASPSSRSDKEEK